jgi:ribosomal protein S18 acetylase RimI-like enzyme
MRSFNNDGRGRREAAGRPEHGHALEITMAHPSDAEELTAIAFAAKRHWGYPETWIEYWRQQLTVTPAFITAHETFVAREGGRILGFAALSREVGTLYLEDLWVLPEEMGREVGRALFRRAQQRGRVLGFDSIEIEADPNAAGFYERMGATRVGTHSSMLDGCRRELPVFRCDTFHEPDETTESESRF